jgi:hypothetical protein
MPAPQDGPIYLGTPPRAKLSETILEYAEPLLADAQNERETRTGVSVAIKIWNLSLMPKQEARAIVASQLDKTFDEDCAEKRAFLALFDEMYRRKQDLFAHDNRMVSTYDFRKTGEGSYHLNVVGIFPAPGPEPVD